MVDVIALNLVPSQEFLSQVRRAWDRGAAVMPMDPRLPVEYQKLLIASLRPTHILDTEGIRSLPHGLPAEVGDALVCATSGSSGTPKGVVHTLDALQAAAFTSTTTLGFDSSTCWLSCLPLHHIGGFSTLIRAIVCNLAIVVHESFEPDEVTKAARAGATHVSLVPTMLQRIDASHFRTILCGGSRPPEDLPGNVVTTYGMTESAGGVVYNGLALNGVGLRINAEGEIWLSGPTMLRCYRDGSDPKDSEGWYRTGDAGSVDPSTGILAVAGRTDDLIITGGENVWPEPVEVALLNHPGVQQVAVVGRPDPEWGERVCAIIVPTDLNSPPSLEELRDQVNIALPRWCAPKEVEFVASIERTPLGKPRRAALRQA
ncbi:MAG TPA: AMP-dependent synthetase [Acidimicrobiaceae bacterium]|nr:AMP-dependent synthetase [Acidimicrobiaceae bacterium]